ncbi:MAG TPA: N-acetylglutaminylglutamine synthetase [Acidimicrobiales bacterium]|nr:N-acetylglutaminylglutamine synthetase [Acidimicrobiales bacterium]
MTPPTVSDADSDDHPGGEAVTAHDVALECGWGRLVFGQTFDDGDALAAVLRSEELGQRDICLYHPEPHVLVSRDPGQLFVDPSHTYRRRLDIVADEVERCDAPGVRVRLFEGHDDAEAINRIYTAAGMVTAPPGVMEANHTSPAFHYLVAEDTLTGEVIGTVTGIDHHEVFGDPEHGTSLWCLAVDPQCLRAGVGEALTRELLVELQSRGRRFCDLSVMHDNLPAIRLYEKLGFERVPVFVVKRKNPINEPLFVGPVPGDIEALNPYARIIADEARRRGIFVDVIDAEGGFLRLSYGGREVVTRESLSELTSGVAVSWCDDKRVTRRMLDRAGLSIPEGVSASTPEDDAAFLDKVGEVVVKPARGEQGRGITVGVTDPDHLERAVVAARSHCPEVLIERRHHGEDVRVVVIGHEVVAASVRRPATVIGDGRHTVEELIKAQSRRRASATGGESTIPLDDSTVETVVAAGWSLDHVLPESMPLEVRRTANLHTGGTIHDVTADLHPALAEAAVTASRVLDLPVTGLDLLVTAVDQPEYVIIEANERPGLANHEPQPTAERFVDLLFPSTRALPRGWDPSNHGRTVAGQQRHHAG